MGKQKQETDGRSNERLLAHYKVEKELADRLRCSSKEERLTLYTTVYDELYRRVHDHPQLLRRRSIEERKIAIASQMLLLNRFLFPKASFLEVGAGDCALSIHVAKMVARVYAVDVSRQISCTAALPENCQFVLSEGCSVGVPAGSIDVAYSYQLMEHLHPLDASEQLENIYAALAPGGRYVCVTPNKLSGPHDIFMH